MVSIIWHRYVEKLKPIINRKNIDLGLVFLTDRKYSGGTRDGHKIWECGNPQLYCRIDKGFFKDWYICTYKYTINIVNLIDNKNPNMNSAPYLNCNGENCGCDSLIY